MKNYNFKFNVGDQLHKFTYLTNRIVFMTLLMVITMVGCSSNPSPTPTETKAGIPDDMRTLAEDRGLIPDDITAALKTYTPSGKHDEINNRRTPE